MKFKRFLDHDNTIQRRIDADRDTIINIVIYGAAAVIAGTILLQVFLP